MNVGNDNITQRKNRISGSKLTDKLHLNKTYFLKKSE